MSRSKRLANGQLRPAYRRNHKKRQERKRAEWLAEFDPDARKAFFDQCDVTRARFARPFAREHGIPEIEAEATLARLADAAGWLKLTTRGGRVVGIAPERKAPPSGA